MRIVRYVKQILLELFLAMKLDNPSEIGPFFSCKLGNPGEIVPFFHVITFLGSNISCI